MYKMKHNLTPNLFTDQFTSVQHKYETRFSKNSYVVPKIILKSSTFSIRHRGPYVWNNFLSNTYKSKTSLKSFIESIKTKLLLTNITDFKKYF